MDPQEYLKHLWDQIQQQYRNMNASTTSIGQNNPFNNAYFQQLTKGQLGSSGLSPNGAQGGQYGNDLSGVFRGLMDSIKDTSRPAVNNLTDAWHKLISSFK